MQPGLLIALHLLPSFTGTRRLKRNFTDKENSGFEVSVGSHTPRSDVRTFFYGDPLGMLALTEKEKTDAEEIVRTAYKNVPGGNVVQNRGIPLASYYNCWAVVKDDSKIYALIMGWIPKSLYTKPCSRMNNVKIGVAAANGKEGKRHLKDLGELLLRSEKPHRWWVEVSPPLFWSWIKFAPVIQQPVAIWNMVGTANLKAFCSKDFRGTASVPVRGCFERTLGDEAHEKLLLGCPTDMIPSIQRPHPYVNGSALRVCGYVDDKKTAEMSQRLYEKEVEIENSHCDLQGLLERGLLVEKELCDSQELSEAKQIANVTEDYAISQVKMQQAFLNELHTHGEQLYSNRKKNAAYMCRIPEEICVQLPQNGKVSRAKRAKVGEWLRFVLEGEEIKFASKLNCEDVEAHYHTESPQYRTLMTGSSISNVPMSLNAAIYPSRPRVKLMLKMNRNELVKKIESSIYMRPWGEQHDVLQIPDENIYVVSPTCSHDSQYSKIWILSESEVKQRYVRDPPEDVADKCAPVGMEKCPYSIPSLESRAPIRAAALWKKAAKFAATAAKIM